MSRFEVDGTMRIYTRFVIEAKCVEEAKFKAEEVMSDMSFDLNSVHTCIEPNGDVDIMNVIEVK